MYVRDPSLLRRPARRLYTMVRLANWWLILFSLVAITLLAIDVFPGPFWRLVMPAFEVVFVSFWLLALIAIPSWFAIRFGLVKCPCCGSRFTSSSFSWLFDRKCDNCGFDVSNVKRQGDF
jgi:hypothetical protein